MMSELLKEHIEDMIANGKALLKELQKAKEVTDLTEANALLREMRKTYIFNVDANGAPKAELGDIIKLIDRVNKHLEN
jgi:hypothetical protein